MNLKKSAFCAGAVLLFLGALISTQLVYAKPAIIRSMPPGQDFCIMNLTDFNNLKSQLPSFLQNPPVLLGADTRVSFLRLNVVAALKLSFRGNTLVLSSDLWDPTPGKNARYTDMQEVRRVCFYKSAKKMVMQFGNGSFGQSTYTDGKLVSAEGINLLPVTAAQHEAYINKIRAKNGGRAGSPKPVGVTQ